MVLGTDLLLLFLFLFFSRVSRVLGGSSSSYFNYSVSPYDDGYVLYLQYKL
jgi:hypothetical protein